MIFDAHVEEVIITNLSLKGEGTEHDPVRRVLQIWRKDGTLIAEKDEWAEQKRDTEGGLK